MKKIVSLSALALSLSLSVFAQGPEQRTPEQRAENKTKKLTTELGLSADQASKVKATILQKAQEADAIKAKYADASDKSAMKQELKTVKETEDNQLKGILSADQYAKYQTTKEEHRGGHQGGGQGQHQHHGNN